MAGKRRPRIVIVDCGFGGLFAARALRRAAKVIPAELKEGSGARKVDERFAPPTVRQPIAPSLRLSDLPIPLVSSHGARNEPEPRHLK